MLTADDPRAHWQTCSPDIRSKIIDDIMTVRVPAPRGRWFKDRDAPTIEEWDRFAEHLDITPKVVGQVNPRRGLSKLADTPKDSP